MPPYDLVVSRMERRPYVAGDRSVKVPPKLSAPHYHLNLRCLQEVDPLFNIQSLKVPEEVQATLTEIHKEYLLHNFGYQF